VSGTVRGYRFVEPRALAALRDLELAARTVVDGFMLGTHVSHRAGAGLEFSQFRSYQPGDDLRRVDWKLYARSDRFFVRESESETSLTLRIVLDATASMAHTEAVGSTFDYARFLAASLALLAERQGDAAGLFALSDGDLRIVRPGRHHQHFHRLLHALEQLAPHGAWPEWRRVEAALSADSSRGVVVFLSDLHQREDEIFRAARRLAAARHDVLVVHLAGRSELEFPWRGSTIFEEAETGRRLELDATQARADDLRGVESEHRDLARALEAEGIGYHRVVTDEPLDGALRRFLSPRARGG
jgi:uncharacterized protein (DUF58 family)